MVVIIDEKWEFVKRKCQKNRCFFKKILKNETLQPQSCKIGSFPAGAETHIYSKNKNKNNETFIPILLGVADIFNMHSPLEKINYVSLQKGYELIKEMFLKFNK